MLYCTVDWLLVRKSSRPGIPRLRTPHILYYILRRGKELTPSCKKESLCQLPSRSPLRMYDKDSGYSTGYSTQLCNSTHLPRISRVFRGRGFNQIPVGSAKSDLVVRTVWSIAVRQDRKQMIPTSQAERSYTNTSSHFHFHAEHQILQLQHSTQPNSTGDRTLVGIAQPSSLYIQYIQTTTVVKPITAH